MSGIATARLRAFAAMIVLAAAAFAAPAGASQTKVFNTTVSYVSEFYPLWFTYYQSRGIRNKRPSNRLVGPDKVTPLYKIVVAINVDTLYASTFLNLAAEPVVMTIPDAKTVYSMLVLDPYGNTYKTTIPAQTPGTYALTGPGFDGTLPPDVTQVKLPYNTMVIIFRADKYASDGQNLKIQAAEFRRRLKMQTLSAWEGNHDGGGAKILPEVLFAAPFKQTADKLATQKPLQFLTQLQVAVASSNTPPMTAHQQQLSDKFNALFAKGGHEAEFAEGVQAAHKLILDNYYTHVLSGTTWVHFNNIGTWSARESVDRSSIAEFIQYANDHKASSYYQTFADSSGAPLDGSSDKGYVLKIPRDQIPQAERFWSFTAYTPDAVELIKNDENKYGVASYTKGLTYDPDGGITLYFAHKKPHGVPEANWLPVGSGLFNIMLRVYGPEGSVADDTYVPPPIKKQ